MDPRDTRPVAIASPASLAARAPLLILQGALALLALGSGAQLLATGAGVAPGPGLAPDDIGLDAMLRFEGGVWTGLGLVLLLCLHRIAQKGQPLRAAWMIVFWGGLIHCYAIRRIGYESRELLYSAVMEVLAPVALGVWQALVARPAAPRSPAAPPRRAPVALQAAVGLCAALAIYIGARAIYFGSPLPEALTALPGSVDLQGALHFVSGIWLGLGLVLAYAALDLSARGDALRVASLIIFAGGVGRLIGLARYGSHGPSVPTVVALELLVPIGLCAWHYLSLRERQAAGSTPHPASPTLQRQVGATR